MTRAMATNPDVSVPTVSNKSFVRHTNITQDVDDTVRVVFMLYKPRSMPALLARMDLQSGYYLSAATAGILWDKYGVDGSHDPETGERIIR